MANDVKLGEAFIDVRARLQKVEGQLRSFENETKRKGKDAGREYGRQFGGSAANTIKNVVRGAIVAITGGLVGRLVKNIVATGARFEGLRLRLEQLKGSAEAGAAAMQELVAFSAGTPFQLTEIIEAEAALEAFGARGAATVKEMGDLAVFMGVDIVEAANAFGRAFAGGAGAADIFRERGILNLIKMQSGIKDFKDVTLKDFRRAMIQTFTDPDGRVAGGTAKLAATLEGRWSTFKDNLTLLFRDVGNQFESSNKRMLEIAINVLAVIRQNLPAIISAIGKDIDTALKRTLIVPRTILGLLESAFDKLPEGVQDKVKGAGEKIGNLFGEALDAGIDQAVQGSETLKLMDKLREDFQNIGKGQQGASPSLSLPTPAGGGGSRQRNFGLGLNVQDQVTANAAQQFGAGIERGRMAMERMQFGDRLRENMEQIPSITERLEDGLRSSAQSLGLMVARGRNLGDILLSAVSALLPFLVPGGIGGFLSGFIGGIGAHSGGRFQNGRKIGSFANGGRAIIPAGFPNDSFNLGPFVESGEIVDVTPAARAGDESRLLANIAGRIESLEANTIMAMRKFRAQVAVQQSIEDRGIQLTVEKAQRESSMFR